jgi:translation initiation factor RLI1
VAVVIHAVQSNSDVVAINLDHDLTIVDWTTSVMVDVVLFDGTPLRYQHDNLPL